MRPQLKYYAAVSTKPEFLQRLGAAMEEFLSCCLAPEALREAARSVSGQFAQKLEELAILYESYLSVCKSGRQDPVTRLQRAQTILQETDFASEHIFLSRRLRGFYGGGASDPFGAAAAVAGGGACVDHGRKRKGRFPCGRRDAALAQKGDGAMERPDGDVQAGDGGAAARA